MKTENVYKILMLLIAAFAGMPALLAQSQVPMADGLRAEGKIYVVVAIILVIFIGIIVYLASLDKKIKKLEDQLKERK